MAALTPSFTSSIVQSDRSDGYWVENIKIDSNDRVPSIIAYVRFSCYNWVMV